MVSGKVVSLHLHPVEPGAALSPVDVIYVLEGKGIQGNHRKFGLLSKRTGKPAKRQVSLIEREQLAEHSLALGHPSFAPGDVRSNIETEGINLVEHVGRRVQIGGAILFLYEPRKPCHKMDDLVPGLRERMENNRQGVMAEVVQSGEIRVGDTIRNAGILPAARQCISTSQVPIPPR